MAITAYTGRPGSGKSYAMVEQVVLDGVKTGRRVLTNIEGVDPAKFIAQAISEGVDPDKVGAVVVFHGDDAIAPDFWPTEGKQDGCFVHPGDLIVFDEWRLTWPVSGKLPQPDLEAFLRFHRHLTSESGVSCDVVIGTQLITDVHRNFRGLIQRSYKFKKLDSVGASKAFTWLAFEGHLQPKGEHYSIGHGRYRPEIFALYSSYSTTASATERATDSRGNVFAGSFKWMVIAGLLVAALSGWGLWRFFSKNSKPAPAAAQVAAAPQNAGAAVPLAVGSLTSRLRIVGTVRGSSIVVIVSDGSSVRYLDPDGFRFDDDGRAVSGSVDGVPVFAQDVISVAPVASPIGSIVK